jgi:hypothetical protein
LNKMTEEPKAGWKEALGAEAGNPSAARTSGCTVTALGRDWLVSPCTARIKAQFEEWVQGNAHKAATKVAHPELARRLDKAYINAYATGAYFWSGEFPDGAGSAVREALSDLPGWHHLFFLGVRRCLEGKERAKFTEADAMRIWKDNPGQCATAVGWMLGNSPGPAGERPGEESEPPALDDEEDAA